MKIWLWTLVFASVSGAQTLVDLKSQSRNIDFSGATSVKPVPVGTVLPATCATGELFFKTNAATGEKIYGCESANTWVTEGGSNLVTGFTDLQSSATSSVLTIGQGRVNFILNGLPVVLTLGPGTITRNAGTETGTFLIFADYNAGTPVLRCLAGAGINISNYTVSSSFSGATCGVGSAFPAHSIPVAIVDISGGGMQPPQDVRTALSRDPVMVGAGLVMTGNVISLGSGIGTGGVKRIPYSALPACTSLEANTEYRFTDGTGLSAQCNGVSHAYFYNDQPVALPGLVSGFTKVNAADGREITDDQGGLYVKAVSGGGDNLVTALKSLGGGTDIRAAVVFGSGGADSNFCGLVLTDGVATSSKATVFGRQAQSNAWVTQFMNYSSYTTDVAATQRAAAGSGTPVWLRVVIAAGNHTFYVSADGGRTWEQTGTQSEYETATHYGVGCDARGTTTAAAMLVVSLSVQ